MLRCDKITNSRVNQSGAARNVDRHLVRIRRKLLRLREVLHVRVHATLATELLVIAAQDDPVRPRILDADRIIGERLGRMKIEDEHEIRSIEDDHLVVLVLPADVALKTKQRGLQFPRLFFFLRILSEQ